MTTTQMIVWPDTTTADRTHIELIALSDCLVEQEQFILIGEGDTFQFFAKIDERPVNISPTLQRDDPATFSALTKKLSGDVKSLGIEQHNLLHYRAHLLQRYERATGETSEPLTAPPLGTLVRLATAQEALTFLRLPDLVLRWKFAQIFHTDIPLCVSRKTFFYHWLLAGATGQGKTTTISNFVAAAHDMGATIYLFDLKPDYQHIEDGLSVTLPSIPGTDISYWNLNAAAFRADTVPIAVHFSELIPETYIAKASGSDLQYQVWMHMYERFREQMIDTRQASWTLNAFHDWMPKNQYEAKQQKELYPTGDIPHETTLAAHYRIKRAKPNWVDRVMPARGMLSAPSRALSFFEHPAFLQPHHVHVVQAEPGGDKDYGLFLTTLMEHVRSQKTTQKLTHPVLIIMDEAEDVFAGGEFAQQCTKTIAGVIRKGRSQKIGVVISVQSAANIPHDIAQNLNSIIAYRHNSEDAAGHIRRLFGKDATNLQALDPGNALVRIFGSKAVVRAKLDTQAFQLVGDAEDDEDA